METELSEDQQKEILQKLLDEDAKRVEAIKKSVDTKPAFQDGFKKAKSEVFKDSEKDLKEKFGLESDKMGLELVEELVSKKSEGGQGGDLTEDAIKRSKVFQDMERTKNNPLFEGTFVEVKSEVPPEVLKLQDKKANYRDWETDRKSTRLNSSHSAKSRMPSSA